jgi:large exoprotein involved in heme utilization and adhesion
LDQALKAQSQTGIDGVVDINAPDVDVAGSLAALSDTTLDASDSVSPPCSSRRRGEIAGSFVIAGRQGLPPGPEGMLDAWPAGGDSASTEIPAPGIALASGCRD